MSVKPKITLQIELIDKEGKVVKRKEIKNVNSFLKNFAVFLRSTFLFVEETAVDVGGTSRSIYGVILDEKAYYGIGLDFILDFHNFKLDAPDNDASYGTVVGTGTTAPTPTDYTLEAKIPHGTGAGQLDYSAVTVEAVVVDTKSVIKIIRNFTNLSGATITVSEAGIIVSYLMYGRFAGTYYTYKWKFLIIRDVISPAVDVPDGYTLKVTYSLEFPV